MFSVSLINLDTSFCTLSEVEIAYFLPSNFKAQGFPVLKKLDAKTAQANPKSMHIDPEA